MPRIASIVLALLCALVLFPATSVRAAPADQEQIAMEWIDAHNSGDVENMAAFRAKHMKLSTMKDWQAMFRRMVDDLGSMEVGDVMIPRLGEVRLGVMSSGEDAPLSLIFTFDAEQQDQIAQVAIEADGGGRDLPGLPLTDDWSRNEKVLDEYLQQMTAEDRFSGAVAVYRKGQKLYESAHGLASREFNVPNTLQTRFDVGSMNKDYTRVAILQLEQAGKLKRSDKVGAHLPDYPNERVRNEVTIDQLIHHRSGMGDYFTEEYFQTPMGNLREVEDYIPIWGPKPLLSDPGSRKKYSNYGYTVLGAVIEKVSGMSYPDYVTEKIFRPAGMTRTGFFATDEIVPDVAVGYTMKGKDGPADKLYRNTFLEPAKGGPWGKSYSTVEDMNRFFDALLTHKLVPKELNWLNGGWERTGAALFGGGPGLNAGVLIEDGWMIVVLANLDPPVAGEVAETILRSTP